MCLVSNEPRCFENDCVATEDVPLEIGHGYGLLSKPASVSDRIMFCIYTLRMQVLSSDRVMMIASLSGNSQESLNVQQILRSLDQAIISFW